MITYRVTYENRIEGQKMANVKVFQYCTIQAPDIKTALTIFESQFCWECVKIQKIK